MLLCDCYIMSFAACLGHAMQYFLGFRRMGNVCEDIVLVLHGKDACVLCDALVGDCDCFPNGIRGAE